MSPRDERRLDIQGLRALAVALVVVFHLMPKSLSGGYIGVDVFFVISGYLIIGNLAREVERDGSVKLGRFWARRARRLLPAALLVLAVSAVMVLVLLPSSVTVQNMEEIAFATVYLVNWLLAANSVDYLAEHNTPSIAQHYWSLSVEEQFYIAWPLIISIVVLLTRRWEQRAKRWVLPVTLALVGTASFVFSIIDTTRSQPSAYFVTTTRAWEFAVGGLVALIPAATIAARWRHAVSWVALWVIAACAATFNADTAFPGWIAALPVLSVAALLWVGDSDSVRSPQYLFRAAPIQSLGDISYSVYLWHWPLIIGVAAVQNRPAGPKTTLGLVVLTLTLGWLSKRFVEDPIRKGPGPLRRTSPTLLLSALAMALVLVLSITPIALARAQQARYHESVAAGIADTSGCFGAYAVLNACDRPYAWTSTVNPKAAATDLFPRQFDREHCAWQDTKKKDIRHCQYAGAGRHVALVGDSHAEAVTIPIVAAARQLGWALDIWTMEGCAGLNEVGPKSNDAERDCAAWGERVRDSIRADSDIELVVFANRSVAYPSSLHFATLEMAKLKSAGKQIAVVRTVPGAPNTLPLNTRVPTAPQCVERSPRSYDACSWVAPKYNDWAVAAADEAGVRVLDTWAVLCASGRCHTVIGGTIVYFDNNHMTTTFAKTLTPWFVEQLSQTP